MKLIFLCISKFYFPSLYIYLLFFIVFIWLKKNIIIVKNTISLSEMLLCSKWNGPFFVALVKFTNTEFTVSKFYVILV